MLSTRMLQNNENSSSVIVWLDSGGWKVGITYVKNSNEITNINKKRKATTFFHCNFFSGGIWPVLQSLVIDKNKL